MGLDWALAGASVIGGLLGGHSAKKNAEYQARLQRENWIYEQSHAHQLEVEDLKNAGLNPILSATNAQMAGNMSVTPQDPSNWSGITNAIVHSALEGKRLDNDLKRIQIQEKSADAQIKKLESDSVVNAWKTYQIKAETEKVQRDLFEQVDLYELRTKLMELQGSRLEAEIDKLGNETYVLGTQSNLNIARTLSLTKEVVAGAWISKFLPKEYIDDIENLGFEGAMTKWKTNIQAVLEKHANEIPGRIRGYIAQKWDSMNEEIPIHGHSGGDF